MKNLEEAIIDALIEGLGSTLKNIKEIRDAYKNLEPKVKAEISSSGMIKQVKNNFPKNLAELLTFEIKDDCAIIKPKRFLGSNNFAKIAAIVRNLSGEYVSAGKESHFKIPR